MQSSKATVQSFEAKPFVANLAELSIATEAPQDIFIALPPNAYQERVPPESPSGPCMPGTVPPCRKREPPSP